MPIKESELILNPDGSIYHINLKPEQLADTVIVVGDPNRVERVAQHFDNIEFKVNKREFYSQTGTFKGKRITVISTGIGTDNIDIVINELDALANIDFKTRTVKEEVKSLDIIRIGTSGSLQEHIPVDSFVISEFGLGFDSLMYFYQSENILFPEISQHLMTHLNWDKNKSKPYIVECHRELFTRLSSNKTFDGFTATNVGFYGPQGRVLRLPLQDASFNDKLATFDYNGLVITNMEMETAAIYGMARLLGHRAVSLNAIIANRATGEFTENPRQVINNLIEYTLNQIVNEDN
ncbi:nucleoside phosphorylase [Mangrovimonas sp. ST2L15]|uniref:nucleoside phosphorylase n=1 Tax=Mangrovimonas sp. ST2L15 TaxID=1645916 RepID=UPI0006B601C9|nr:nucleoside phosphorylase [Mangrovimonas sp. ST2L15]